jgi:hypothetical protein
MRNAVCGHAAESSRQKAEFSIQNSSYFSKCAFHKELCWQHRQTCSPESFDFCLRIDGTEARISPSFQVSLPVYFEYDIQSLLPFAALPVTGN